MKLPRLGDPKTVTYREESFLGENVTTEITTASEFDMLPTWAQWSILIFGVLMLFACMLVFIFHY